MLKSKVPIFFHKSACKPWSVGIIADPDFSLMVNAEKVLWSMKQIDFEYYFFFILRSLKETPTEN